MCYWACQVSRHRRFNQNLLSLLACIPLVCKKGILHAVSVRRSLLSAPYLQCNNKVLFRLACTVNICNSKALHVYR